MPPALDDYDEFLALAAHELKTPTATLSATAQLIRRQLERQGTLESDQLLRAVERLQEQSERLGLVVDNLLDAARINAGGLTLQLELTDVALLMSTVIARIRSVAPNHTLVWSAPAPLQLMIDPARIEQVVVNLLSNAIKYSPDGGPVEVELARTPDGKACISVRDFGVGLPPEQRDGLFERFYRAHADREMSGLGLGLFVSRHLVELHGGTITADSPPGGGARFIVLLPAATI